MSYLKKKRAKVEEITVEEDVPVNYNYDETIGDWIMDTDPGVDDSIAITLAMNMIKNHLILLSIQAGNNGVEKCVKNAKKLCVINRRKINISHGGYHTLSTINPKGFSVVHGEDGLYDLTQYSDFDEKYDSIFTDYINKSECENIGMLKSHSAIEIIKLSKEYEKNNKKLNILAIGPLTNIALAYMIDPSVVNRINRTVIMGGSYNSFGNVQPSGEFNFDCDNVSAKKVLDKFKNVEVWCWESCLTHKVKLSDYDIKEESKNSEKYRYVKAILDKKAGSIQEGVFADYGAAINSFFPKSVSSYENLYCEVIIDSEKDKNSKFIISEKNNFVNKKKPIIKLIKTLRKDWVIGLFNEMINN